MEIWCVPGGSGAVHKVEWFCRQVELLDSYDEDEFYITCGHDGVNDLMFHANLDDCEDGVHVEEVDAASVSLTVSSALFKAICPEPVPYLNTPTLQDFAQSGTPGAHIDSDSHGVSHRNHKQSTQMSA